MSNTNEDIKRVTDQGERIANALRRITERIEAIVAEVANIKPKATDSETREP